MNRMINLEGQRLSAVTFVEDYVQLALDHSGISAVVDPEVNHAGNWLKRGDPGYLEALVALPGQHVAVANVVPNEVFEVRFDGGDVFRVVLTPEAHVWGPEAVTVQHDDGSMEVW